ncbi:small nucleolar ribonucleoprotein complex subunit Utp14 [Purpureocillium lavendulum]|uniref:Small nucleolar ribonucleoprotein complex subunit Utp14 n=1 Tax=Purpureocillium lavendulum TaxID=1247861 RepID=A0AB34FUY9_9HYPO|nr:small nucleolar ribonucleoprotein complex subunit Utp14 [Purpureocillium lavendulum]
MVVCKRACSASAPPAKRKKSVHPETRPASFWDNLSRPLLTKDALQEHTRRVGSFEPDSHVEQDFAYQLEVPKECLAKPHTFSRHGGPDMQDVVGYIFYSHQDEQEDEEGDGDDGDGYDGVSTIPFVDEDGPYDMAFAQHLVDHGVFAQGVFPQGFVLLPCKSRPPPSNMPELKEVLSRRRASIVGSDGGYDDLIETNNLVYDGENTPDAFISLIEGPNAQRDAMASDVLFRNLDHLTDGTLMAAQPAVYHGVPANMLTSRVLAKFRHQIAPSPSRMDPILPTVFLEAKSSDASEGASTCQMLYAMALGARAHRTLQDAVSGGAPTKVDRAAYTFGCVYQDGWLTLFACYALPTHEKGWCVPALLGRWDLLASRQSFCEGVKAYRNVRDWAAKKRAELVQRANEHC